MAPAALLARDGEYLLERGHKPSRPVAHSRLGSDQTRVLSPISTSRQLRLDRASPSAIAKSLLAAFVHNRHDERASPVSSALEIAKCLSVKRCTRFPVRESRGTEIHGRRHA